MKLLFLAVVLLVGGVNGFTTTVNLRPGGEAWTIRNPTYPMEGVALGITFAITSSPGSVISLNCGPITLIPGFGSRLCDARVEIRDTAENKRICSSLPSFSTVSASNQMVVVMNSGLMGRMSMQCTVSARGGSGGSTGGSTGGSSGSKSPFFSTESKEIDSSEHGGPPGKVGTTCPCGMANKDSKRIVGGTVTETNEYPFAVALVNKADGRQFCGGTILTKNHVITAAHCTDDANKGRMKIEVHAGAHHVSTYSAVVQKIDVKTIRQHTGYNPTTIFNDITLLVLAKSLVFGPTVGPACILPVRRNMEKQNIKIIGWGRVSHTGPASPVLKEVNLRVVPMPACARSYPGGLQSTSTTQLCAHGSRRGACMGDSGGPVVWVDPDTNRYTLVGLVSFGKICASDDPSVHTDVSAYYSWIQQNIQATSPADQTCSKK